MTPSKLECCGLRLVPVSPSELECCELCLSMSFNFKERSNFNFSLLGIIFVNYFVPFELRIYILFLEALPVYQPF